MKKIYYIGCEIFGEQDFFFDENFNLLHCWDRNDAMYSDEYMKPLFRALGFKVISFYIPTGNKKIIHNSKIQKIISKYLQGCGATEEDLKELYHD